METSKQWIEQAKSHMDKLEKYIQDWHPRSAKQIPVTDDFTPTAPMAERARLTALEGIRSREAPEPLIRFRTAIETDDVKAAIAILSAAWFGVPETTSCWRFTGFSEAVNLIDDPPDDIELWEDD